MTDLMALQRRIAPDFDRLVSALSRLVRDDEESDAQDSVPGGLETDSTLDHPQTRSSSAVDPVEARITGLVGRDAAGTDPDLAPSASRDEALSGELASPRIAMVPRDAGLGTPSTPADPVRAMASVPLRHAAARHAPRSLPLPATARARLPGSTPAARTAAPGRGISRAIDRKSPAASGRFAAALPSGLKAPSMIDAVISTWPAPELLEAPAWRAHENRSAETLPDPFADAELEQRLADLLEDAARTAGIDW
jgi:hypothetical protein